MAKTTDKKDTKAIAKITTNNSGQSAVERLSISAKQFLETAYKSGNYKDSKSLHDLYLKVSMGASLGIDPATSLSAIVVVNNKLSFTSNLIAARIAQSGRHRYEVIEKSADKCVLQFYTKVEEYTPDGKLIYRWHTPGPPEVFSIAMAKRAGLTDRNKQVWSSYPEALLFARCISAMARTYAPEIFMGAAIYSFEELGAEVSIDPNGEVVVDTATILAQSPKELVQDAEFTEPVESPESSKQFAQFLQLLKETSTPEATILAHYQKQKLEQLTAEDLDAAIRTLTQKKEAKP